MLSVTIDVTAPTKPVVASIADDSGSSSTDEITNDQTLTFSGTAENNASVEVFIGASSIGTTTANGSGAWTFDHTATTLTAGTYSITAKATDVAGNTSVASTVLSVIIAITTPTVAFNTTSSNGLESVSSADLQVDLSSVSALNVTVNYAVTGTATGSGTDFTLANGTLTISAGDANDNITIASIVNDLLDENNETVIVTLSNPTNATLGTNTVHTYTINDNDALPSVAFNLTNSNANIFVDITYFTLPDIFCT